MDNKTPRLWMAAVTLILSTAFAEAKPPHHAPKAPPQIAWQTYHSDNLSFQIKVPKSWLTHTSAKAVGFVHQTKVERAAVGVMKSDRAGVSLEDEAAQQYESQGHPKDWTQSYVNLAGQRALKIVVSVNGDERVRMVQYYIETQNGHYLIQCIAPRTPGSATAPSSTPPSKASNLFNQLPPSVRT